MEVLINNALKRCNYHVIDDEAFKKGFHLIYPFTTENIDGYIDHFDLDGKSLLTVGSSGDQVFSASVKGSRDITVLDVNPYTKVYFYFKLAALIALDIDEFLLFFRYKDYPRVFKDNRHPFRDDLLERVFDVLESLDKDSYLFWDTLFSNYSATRIRKTLFNMDENRTYVIRDCNSYLKCKEYYELAKKVMLDTDVTFITGDLFKTEIDRSFDNIWLSNIGNYLSRHFVKIMVDKMDKYLNKDGTMLVSYLYQTDENSEYREGDCLIYDLPKTFEILSDYPIELKSFKGVDGLKFDEDIKDSVLIYKKK